MMGWPTVLGFISYIVIICCLTFWLTKHHFRNSRLWKRNLQTDNADEPDEPGLRGTTRPPGTDNSETRFAQVKRGVMS